MNPEPIAQNHNNINLYRPVDRCREMDMLGAVMRVKPGLSINDANRVAVALGEEIESPKGYSYSVLKSIVEGLV